MSELPEVQTIVDDLNNSRLTGAQIRTASVFWPRTVHGMAAATFCRKMRGRRIVAIGRRGKFIVISLENGASLLIHLRMSGRLILPAADSRQDKHEHVWLTFTDGRRLRFHDTR